MRADSTHDELVAEARRHPMFELRVRAGETGAAALEAIARRG